MPNSIPDLPLLFRALQYSARAHNSQRRKGGNDVPYINHPIDVATQLATIGSVTDLNILSAAILHDTVEDTTTTPDDIAREFGDVIAALVAEVTDDPDQDSATQKITQEREAPSKSRDAKLIRLADKTCNVRDIANAPPPKWSDERRMEYFAWAERVVAGVRGVNAPLDADFDRAVEEARAVVSP